MHPDEIFCQKGFILVAHEPGSVSGAPGSHIRGSMVRASEAGDEEIDLVLPGTGRYVNVILKHLTFCFLNSPLEGN